MNCTLAAERWHPGARVIESPNFDRRPGDASVELVVIHAISLPPGDFGGRYVEDFFTNALDCTAHPYFSELAGVRVSAHFFIDRQGSLVQFVPTDERAWHAGQSRWCEREACNDFSVGIELEGDDDTPFADAQYQALETLLDYLRARYPGIGAGNVVGHCHIAPDRKTDPGPHFDWRRVGVEPRT